MTGSAEEKRGCNFSKVNLVMKFDLKPLPESGRKLDLVTDYSSRFLKNKNNLRSYKNPDPKRSEFS